MIAFGGVEFDGFADPGVVYEKRVMAGSDFFGDGFAEEEFGKGFAVEFDDDLALLDVVG